MAFELPIRKELRVVGGRYSVVEIECEYDRQPIKDQISNKLVFKKIELNELTNKVFDVELEINRLEELLTEV